MNSFGTSLRVSIFGESHGAEIGTVVDGVPAGLALKEEDFLADIFRRSPQGAAGTARQEKDLPHLVSGVFNGHTTGAPITVRFCNSDTRPEDYEQFASTPRPGHADYSASVKWDGYNDPRGGGHLSGRQTLPVVAAGVIAKKALHFLLSRNSVPCIDSGKKTSPFFETVITEIGGCPDSKDWDAMIAAAREHGDSLGGVVECSVRGLPAGLGEPWWDNVESLMAHAMFAIPGVRGVEFGDGFRASRMKGSEHNDPFGPDGPVKNGAGGVNGGITNGAPLLMRVAFKPSSSISLPQRSWNYKTHKDDTLCVVGRHDCCFALRTPVIVEAMAAIVLADLTLRR